MNVVGAAYQLGGDAKEYAELGNHNCLLHIMGRPTDSSASRQLHLHTASRREVDAEEVNGDIVVSSKAKGEQSESSADHVAGIEPARAILPTEATPDHYKIEPSRQARIHYGRKKQRLRRQRLERDSGLYCQWPRKWERLIVGTYGRLGRFGLEPSPTERMAIEIR